jgi:hypothetical protein
MRKGPTRLLPRYICLAGRRTMRQRTRLPLLHIDIKP